MPRRETEWRQEPQAGTTRYHLKWSHGLWPSEKFTVAELDAIHKALHKVGVRDHVHQWPGEGQQTITID